MLVLFVVLVFVGILVVLVLFVVLVFVGILVMLVLFAVLVFVGILVVLALFAVLVFVGILVTRGPELQVRGQVDDAARRVGDQVAQEVGLQAGAVDEHDRRVGYLPSVARRRLEGVRIGARRQHHVHRQSVSPDPGDDVPDDGRGRHDPDGAGGRLFDLPFGICRHAGQRHDEGHEHPGSQVSHVSNLTIMHYHGQQATGPR